MLKRGSAAYENPFTTEVRGGLFGGSSHCCVVVDRNIKMWVFVYMLFEEKENNHGLVGCWWY
jgi:hypothetical protein